MTNPTEACPRCARANAVHRSTCLYCGQAMPNPRPELAPKKRELPQNFDELVRLAMGGKADMGQLQAALRAEARPAAPPASRPVAAPPPVVVEAPALVPHVALAAAEVRAVVDPFDALLEAAQLAQHAHRAGDAHTVSGALVAARRALDAAEAGRIIDPAAPMPLAEPPVPPARSFTLPPIRHPLALVVAGGGPERAEPLATALEVDAATARAIATSPYTRVALRGADESGLERRAARARAAGIGARVVPRSLIQDTPPAWTIVRIGPGLAAAAVEMDLWEDQPSPEEVPGGEEVDLSATVLVVVGEVEVRDGITPREQSRWERRHFAAAPGTREARSTVVDLHTPRHVYRIVEGVTAVVDARGAVGRGSGAVRGWIQGMGALVFAPTEPRRVCAVDGSAVDRRASGWPAWEEHTRLCRVFHRVDDPG